MVLRRWAILLVVIVAAGCTAAQPAPSTLPPTFTVTAITLPGALPEGVFMDYLAYDRARHRVWVPAGNTGSVDVIDTATNRVARVTGFPTAEVERHGTKRTVGPSAATVGDRMAYVGNRGDSSVCAVDAESLRVGACVTLESSPDGLAYVASAKEVWVTTPRDKSIIILDASTAGALTWKAKIRLDGQPEGFAVDDARGVFYTNLEDADRTLTIGIESRLVAKTWLPGCGAGGPKGLALDHARNFLFVACTDHVTALDAGHDGARLSTINVGDGIDNLDYVESRQELYVAAAHAATLVIARADRQGRLSAVATVATAPGARNAVATDAGAAYLTDSSEGRILVVTPAVAAK